MTHHAASVVFPLLALAGSACLISTPSAAETQNELTAIIGGIVVNAPTGDVPLGNPVEVIVTRRYKERLRELEVLQRSDLPFGGQGSGPATIVREDGSALTIQIVPVQTGSQDGVLYGMFTDGATSQATFHLNVVASATGLKRFSLNNFHSIPLVLEDKAEDRQAWLFPEVEYKNLKYPIHLHDSLQIKLSVQQDRANPVISVDEDGMIHALSKGSAVVVGNFDGVIDKVTVDVYTQEGAPAGYRRVQK